MRGCRNCDAKLNIVNSRDKGQHVQDQKADVNVSVSVAVTRRQRLVRDAEEASKGFVASSLSPPAPCQYSLR